MMIISATHRFSAHCSIVVCLVGVKTNSILFIKIDRVIVTQVGVCVISRWPLSQFFSNHKKALLQWLLHLHTVAISAYSFKGFTLWV